MGKRTKVDIRIDEIDAQVKTLMIVRDVLVSIRGDKPSKAKRKAEPRTVTRQTDVEVTK